VAEPSYGPAGNPIEVVPVVVLSQVFPARPSSIPDIRDFVRRCLAESPLTEDGTRQVGETVFRALLDAAGPTGSIQVAFRIFPEHVEVDVLHSDSAILPAVTPGPPVSYTLPGAGPAATAAGAPAGAGAPGAGAPGAGGWAGAGAPAGAGAAASAGAAGIAAGATSPDGRGVAGGSGLDGAGRDGAAGVAAGGTPGGSAGSDGSNGQTIPAQVPWSAGADQRPPGLHAVPNGATRPPADGVAGPGYGPDGQPESFAEWMSSALRREGLTQEAAARQLGVSVKTVSRWVGGATEPRMRDLRRIQEVFGEVPLP
jgi:DNA-binding XRE family transcriptional regulator